jgi:outer membrane immunogenic protein
MRRIVVALLGATVLSVTAAQAADMPTKAPVYKAPVIFNWTGFYVGGYVGGAWGQDPGVTDVNGWNAAGRTWSYGRGSSFIGGGTIGYNWQPVGTPWVFGLEGELGYLHLSGSRADPLSPGLDTVADSKVGDWYGVVAGRLGYAWDRTLLYAKGGVAFVNESASVVDACNTGACGVGLVDTSTGNKTQTTWTVGGGVEYAFTRNWSVKGEYLYLGLNNTLRSCNTAGTVCFDTDMRGVHTAKFGVNYRFGSL